MGQRQDHLQGQREGCAQSDDLIVTLEHCCVMGVIPDAELAKQSFFFMDDVSLEVIEEPPLVISTPLDEYYVGALIPWTARGTSAGGSIKILLLAGERPVAEETRSAGSGPLCGTFADREFPPGVYTQQVTSSAPRERPQTARRQILLTPDPFAW
jgi:hypothetical protein